MCIQLLPHPSETLTFGNRFCLEKLCLIERLHLYVASLFISNIAYSTHTQAVPFKLEVGFIRLYEQ